MDVFHWFQRSEYPYWTLAGVFIFFIYSFIRINLAFPSLANDPMQREARILVETHNHHLSLENFASEIQNNLQKFYQVTEALASNQHLTRLKHKQYVENIETSVTSLENFVRDSEYLQLLESGEYFPKEIETELGTFCKDLIRKTLEDLRQSPQRVLLEMPRKAMKLKIDPALLFLGLYHILENSLLYTVGKVEFRLEADERYCRIRIHDQGLD